MRGMMTGVANKFKSGPSIVIPTFSVNSAAINGSTKYFNTGSQVLDTSSDWSFCGWIKLNTISNNNTMVSDFDTNSGLLIRYRDISNAIRLAANDDSMILDSTFGALSTGVWYFVAATYNTVSGYSLTINTNRDVDVTTAAAQVNRGFHFGRLSSGISTQGIDGALSFFSAYSRTLTELELIQMYNAGEPKCFADLSTALLTDLVGFWDLGNWTDHTGGEITDRSVSGNNLTNNGTTLFTESGLTVECSV